MLQSEETSLANRLVPYLKAGHVQWSGIELPDELPQMWASSSDIEVLRPFVGDLLICEGGEVGRAAIVDAPLPEHTIIQNSLHLVRSSSTCDTRYLKYALEHIANSGWIDIACNKATIAHLTVEKLRELPAPFWEKHSQERIANFLDEKTARIDDLIAEKERLVVTLEEWRFSLIYTYATKGLDTEAVLENEPSVKWLEARPAHWRRDKVSWLFGARKGGMAQLLTKEYCQTIQGYYPVYSGQTENNGIMSQIDRYEFDFGAEGVLFSTTVGAKAMTVAHIGGKFSLSQNCMIIFPKSNDVDIRFFYYQLQVLFKWERDLISEHMQASFRMEDLYSYRIFTPPLSEQRQISACLDQKCAAIDTLIEQTKKNSQALSEYRSSLISAAVTGQLNIDDFKARQLEVA